MNTITEEQFRTEKRVNVRLLRIVLGAGTAAILVTLLFLTLGNSGTGDLSWMVLPYLVVPTAGALAGLIFDITQPMRDKGGFYYLLNIGFSLLIYASLFCLSFILGMSGLN